MSEEGSQRRSRVRIIVAGRVQGVFFRASARDEATRLGTVGWARNEPDGTVLIEAEGAPQALERFTEWCRAGPPEARVKHVEVSPIPPTGEREFVIR